MRVRSIKFTRNETGMALVTVLSLGIVMSIWAYALAKLVVPGMIKASQARHSNILRSSCEATLDWAANSLATTATAFDDVNINDNNPVVTQLDAGTRAAIPLQNEIRASISVLNTVAPATSFLYDSTIATHPNPTIRRWRMVTARAWYQGNPAVSKQVTVILKPIPTDIPAFQYAAFGRAGVTQTGNSTTGSVDTSDPTPIISDTGGDVAAIGPIQLGANSTIGGNVFAYSATNTAAPGTITVSGGSGTKVKGHIKAYGEVQSVFQERGNNSLLGQSPTGNVYNEAPPPDLPGADPQAAAGEAIKRNLGAFDGWTKPIVPSTPTAPPSATNLGAISLSGNQTMTLAPGDYIVSSLSITGNGNLILPSDGTVNLYIQGAGASLNIGGNGITNTSGQSRNLRIWYSGTSDVSISGNGGLTGVIYSPNARVVNNGNGAVTGAVVGNYLDLRGNAPLLYDKDLWVEPITLTVIGGFQTVSWRER